MSKKTTNLILLIKYILNDFENMSEREYLDRITNVFGIYEECKPKNKESALKRIKTLIEVDYMSVPISERPLFIF